MSRLPNVVDLVMEGDDPNFYKFIRGHLYIEALLGQLISRHPNFTGRIPDMFFKKVVRAAGLGILDQGEKNLLLKINKVRNKLAHDLTFSLDFAEAFALVRFASSVGVEFTDTNIHDDASYSEKAYGVYGVISEVLSNTFFHLVFENERLLTPDEFHRLVG